MCVAIMQPDSGWNHWHSAGVTLRLMMWPGVIFKVKLHQKLGEIIWAVDITQDVTIQPELIRTDLLWELIHICDFFNAFI